MVFVFPTLSGSVFLGETLLRMSIREGLLVLLFPAWILVNGALLRLFVITHSDEPRVGQ